MYCFQLNAPLVSRPKVTFVFIAYDPETATDHEMMFDTTSGRSKSLYAIENTVTSTATFRTPIVAKLNSFATIVRLCHAAAIWFKARSMTEWYWSSATESVVFLRQFKGKGGPK